MSFAIPDEVRRRFKEAVPAGQRCAVVIGLLVRKLRATPAELTQVCKRVNRLTSLNQEMEQWEQFDDGDA